MDYKNYILHFTSFYGSWGAHLLILDDGGGGALPYETDRDACRKFWILLLKETIWACLKLFVTREEDQSGRGLSKFLPLKETA